MHNRYKVEPLLMDTPDGHLCIKETLLCPKQCVLYTKFTPETRTCTSVQKTLPGLQGAHPIEGSTVEHVTDM